MGWLDASASGNMVTRANGIMPMDSNSDFYAVVPAGVNSAGMFMIGDNVTVTRKDTGSSITVPVTD